MPMPQNYQAMGSSLLIEALIEAAGERAILIMDEAPLAELTMVQAKIDTISETVLNRMGW